MCSSPKDKLETTTLHQLNSKRPVELITSFSSVKRLWRTICLPQFYITTVNCTNNSQFTTNLIECSYACTLILINLIAHISLAFCFLFALNIHFVKRQCTSVGQYVCCGPWRTLKYKWKVNTSSQGPLTMKTLWHSCKPNVIHQNP